MPLIKDGRAAADPWIALGGDEAVPDAVAVIVGLARWRADREALIRRAGPLGLRLKSDQPPSAVAGDLGRFALVALEFPKFTDGRGYSYARLLRERFGYRGEVRAVGNVLRDQFLFMHRCGFDAFEVPAHDVDVWIGALNEITVAYQPASDDRAPAWRLRHRPAALSGAAA
jgi:uncharacterized protein (DUF934 family)